MNKIKVNSFDIFDTLIGRVHGEPDSIFDIVSKIIDYPTYKHIRKLSEKQSNGTWNDIWNRFEANTKMHKSRIEDIKNIEWNTEKKYSFPITTNICIITNNDILVSDMYATKNMIIDLLKTNNINNYKDIYVTTNGKSSGYIWNQIFNDGYTINQHLGDNTHSDISSPNKYKIKTVWFNANYNKNETILINNNIKNLSNLVRIIRFNNIYYYNNSLLSNIWQHMSYVIPIYNIIFMDDNYKDKYINHYNISLFLQLKYNILYKSICEIQKKYSILLDINENTIRASNIINNIPIINI